jgi:hypothetical protein
METKTITDDRGRKQKAYVEGDVPIIIGPPNEIVDSLGLPEPIATNLHNALHQRGLLNYAAVARNPQSLQGALQEALTLDVQRLTEAFFQYENPQEINHARK